MKAVTDRTRRACNRVRCSVSAVVTVRALTTDAVGKARVGRKVLGDDDTVEETTTSGGNTVAAAVESFCALASRSSEVLGLAVESGCARNTVGDVLATCGGLVGSFGAGRWQDGCGRAVAAGWARQVRDQSAGGAVEACNAGKASTLSRGRVEGTKGALLWGR